MGFTGWPAIVDDDGSTQVGTKLNKALFDLIKAELETRIFSVTNPAVTPASIIDEVIAARGSLGSLNARISVSINSDGTLNIPASTATVASVQAALGSRNVVLNGDLPDWSAGGALAPDSFTLTGAAATIARTGIAQADTFHFGTGSGFAAKITRAGTNWKLTQDVISAADFPSYTNVKSQSFSISVKAKTGIASYLRLVVDDGVTQTASAFHTGGGAEEHLSVTHVISSSATKLSFYVEGISSNGDGYIGGFTGIFATLAPSDWQPLSLQPISSYRRTLNKQISGTSSNGTPSETDMQTYTLPALTLKADGMCIYIMCTGSGAANANAKRVRVYFGAGLFLDNTGLAMTSGYYICECWIWRTGPNAQRFFARYTGTNAFSPPITNYGVMAQDNTVAQIIKITGLGVAAADIVPNMFTAELVP